MRWLLVFIVACLIFNSLQHWFARLGLGRLPGDLRFRVGGRDWFVPITSSLVLSLIVGLISLVV
ncbi:MULTISPECIES: DUF2905 domain-containing protein [unclassified Rubrivivax]|uniref:DUF2905 domain-containing protein n=1 Tax=unclassified Rubrivivax TaxID=2649762 RepID=UPI001E4CE989|nr:MULTISPECIES: DUF2905 domain-containing protein [unclassified Rubrivivax]MCC9596401.1 DUF2905 domain-containing protein [Rubrivivax sp. JA1055]MCC9647255.1 DUF2905 domain-containing protein [Rubrivivax sp. JA1029]